MNQEIIAALDAACAGYVQEELDVLRQVCNVDCPTGDVAGNAKVVAYLKTMFTKADVTVEEIFDETVGIHLVVRIKPEHPDGKILIVAHSDTIRFGDSNVSEHPFRIEGDWVHGLGVVDCKGGLVSSFYSVKVLQEAGLLPNKEIVMIYNCDEETGSHSGRKIFERECVGADMCFAFEPSRGENSIITERNGTSHLTLHFTGKTAHPGTAYRDGRSASKELAQQAMRLFDATDFKNITFDVCNFNSNFSISDKASCRVIASLYSEKGVEMLHNYIDEINNGKPFVDGCTSAVTVDVLHPRMAKNEKNLALYEKVHAAGLLMGIDYPQEPPTGASDACLISGFYGVPTIDAMGPYMKDIHTVNERMYLPSLKERTLLFALTLATL